MKTLKSHTLMASFFLGVLLTVTAQPAEPPAGKKAVEAVPDEAAKAGAPALEQSLETPAAAVAKAAPGAGAEKGLRLNFRGVPLDMVLDYLSEEAGFIIVKETDVTGKVDVWSNQPLTKDEAVDLLDSILNQNKLAAIRNGRTLTIVSREEAKKRNIPVKKGADAEAIPKSDELVTQIIPVKHANVTQLTVNLLPLLGTYAEMTANESANSLILTATQSDIRRMTEIIAALDESISNTSTIKVYPLRYADAKELANVIKELFAPAQQQGGNRGNQFGAGGFGGGFPGAGGGAGGGGGAGAGGRGGGAAGRASTGSAAANTRVVAVADERSNSLVVGAPDDMFATIEKMIRDIDQPIADVTELRVFHLQNADPVETADMLTSLFPDESKTANNNNQQQFRFGGGPFGGLGGGRGGANNSANTSERMKKQGRVLAVPDQRTASVIVSAASTLMPQIEEMIKQLDSSSAKKQKVYVYDLQNADPQAVQEVLRNLFETQQNQRNTRSSQTQTSPLRTRSQQSQRNNTGTGSGFGSGGGGGGGNSGGGTGGGAGRGP